MSFYDESELKELGLAYVGKKVKLSRKASLYNPGNIRIGDYSRIDDFCVLSAGVGGITIGRNIHIAVYSGIIGQAPITLDDFANISSRVMIYSSNDDYSGEALTNPTVSTLFTNVRSAPVVIHKHVIVGSGSIVLPGVTLHEGVAIGALSLVNADCERFGVYAGVPARRLKGRSDRLLEKEREYLAWMLSLPSPDATP